MAYVPQQPFWVPYDPTYYTFPEYQPTTRKEIHRVDTCDCATCESCRAKGNSNIYQWVGEHCRQNPHQLDHPCNYCPPGTPLRTTTTFTPVTPASIRRSQEVEARLRELRRVRRQWYTQVVLATAPDELPKTSEERLQDRNNSRRQMQIFDEILRDDAAITEGEMLLRDDAAAAAAACSPCSIMAGNQAPVFEPTSIADMGPGSCDVEQCQWCASASASSRSGSGSSGDSAGPALDPWKEQEWAKGKGKGKEKEVQPQQEPEEELIMPIWFNVKGPENKETESGTSKSKPESESESSPSPSEALSGSASREF
ncbi:hypothetical protein PG996_011736 [Apiospora saccharicola]|uniref:Uncharacterized protein n=1 Tax=Apiospora saccharicola TaxID=335842 RepID=A0ABR1UIV7_9PEZI